MFVKEPEKKRGVKASIGRDETLNECVTCPIRTTGNFTVSVMTQGGRKKGLDRGREKERKGSKKGSHPE